MKTKNFTLIAATIALSSAAALDHGSISVKNAQLYGWTSDAIGPNETQIDGQTVDYKLVTVGAKTWAYASLNNSGIRGEEWASQLFWYGQNDNTGVFQLTGRITGNGGISYGNTISAFPNESVDISVFQYVSSAAQWTYYGTAKTPYDCRIKNSGNVEDVTAPALATPVIASQSAVQITLNLSATDVSNDYFYYITDETNNYAEVFFRNEVTIMLVSGTDYNFSIKAIDFSGNESNIETVSITGAVFECNNLLEDKALSFYEIYYAPGWAASENYTAGIEGNTLTLHLDDATNEAWQAQFKIELATPIRLIPEGEYSLIMNVTSSKAAGRFFVKFFDGANENPSMDVPAQAITDGEQEIAVYGIICPDGLSQISRMIFDFGWNPADLDMSSDISVCGEPAPDVKTEVKVKNSDVQVYSNDNRISVIASNIKGTEACVYNTVGQLLYSQPLNASQTVIGRAFKTGVYLVKVGNVTRKVLVN
jgi:hypothetical protein